MRIQYVGLGVERDGFKHKKRGADITSRDDGCLDCHEERDYELFERTIKLLQIHGWKFVEMAYGWMFCEVEDRAEYEDLRRDYLTCKKCIANCMKFGF